MKKNIKVQEIFIVLIFLLSIAACSTDRNQDEADSNRQDIDICENQAATQAEEWLPALSENIGHRTSSDAAQANNLSENGAQEEDDGAIYTMEEVKALDIPEDMLAYWLVLNSKIPFVSYNEGNQEFYWDEYFWILGEPNHFLGIPEKNIYWGDPTSFTIVDMNNDGKNEIAVSLAFGIVQILHYEDGVVYGYQFAERGMLPIYSNGIYEGSSGANHGVYHRLTQLNKDGFTEEKIAEVIYGNHGEDTYYEIDGISVSQEDFEEFKQSLLVDGEAERIDYTEDLLDKYLLAGLSEEKLYMIKHVAVEPMTDKMNYTMETEMMQTYYDVLTGKKEFISVMDGNRLFNIDSYQNRNEDDRGEDDIFYFSIVDIDRNGVYEVILTGNETNILYYKDGNIYCYRYRFYEIGAIANNGIFCMGNLYYFGDGDDKFGIINSFHENECVIEEMNYNGNINDDRIRYYYFSEELIDRYLGT